VDARVASVPFSEPSTEDRIMKKYRSSICLTAALLALAAGAPCFAQDSATAKPDDKSAANNDAQMMATMIEMAKPGEYHKMLAEQAGSWTYKVKWWMRPDAPPMESTGTTSVRAVMDGRYIISEHTGKMSMPGADGNMMDVGFQGSGTEGYDNAKKKFVASWIDNMGTGIVQMEGTYDPATKTLTYQGEEQPVPGVKFSFRQVVKYTDKDHHTLEFYEVHGGAEAKTMEITYTRS
jgi:hypothetical protein